MMKRLDSDLLARGGNDGAGGAGERARTYVGPSASPISAACVHCASVGYVIVKEGEYAVAHVCECQVKCPQCRGARYLTSREGGYEVAVPCRCAGMFTRVQLFNDTKIPAGYAHKKLVCEGTHDVEVARRLGAKLDYDGFYDRKNASLREAAARIREYDRTFTDAQRRGLVLVGGFGLGKTHLVCALLASLTLRNGVSCRFVDYHVLTSKIRWTFDGDKEDSESSIIEPLVDTQVLVIDDIGKAQASNWALSVLDQIVTRRYNARRVIFATTNYVPELEQQREQGEMATRSQRRRRDLSESLEERVGERLVSRLRATCDFVTLEATDYRKDGPREAR